MPTTAPTPPEGSDPGASTGTATDPPAGPTAGPTAGHTAGTGSDGVLDDLRALRRRSDGRIIAGVCAGVGRGLGVDPVVLRVILVVLALFGGVGLLLYAAGWLLLPSEGDRQSLLEQQLGRRRDGAPDRAVMIGGLVVLGLLVVSIPWWGFPWHVPMLLVLSVLGLVALVRRNAGEGGAAGPDTANPATSPGSHGYDPDVLDHLPAYPPDHGRGESDDPEATAIATTWRTASPAPSSFWTDPDPLGLEIEDPQLLPLPPVPRQRSVPKSPLARWLLVGTVAASLVVIGAMALAAGHTVPAGGYVAAPLGVVGLGLIAGTWIGRTRSLTAIGVVLAIALVPVTAAGQWPGGTVDTVLQPTSVADIMPTYRYGAGSFVLDLSNVDFTSSPAPVTTIGLGAGEVRVLVPSTVDVILWSTVGLGELRAFQDSPLLREPVRPRAPRPPRAPFAAPDRPRAFDQPSFPEFGAGGGANIEASGADLSRQIVDYGTDEKGGGELPLVIKVGVGSVEVQRVP